MLVAVDHDQAALTEWYVEAGRRLWRISAWCKERILANVFRHRSRSTLREYMSLSKGFDAADDDTKVQLTGLFKEGWGAVLGEIRASKRAKKSQAKNGQPVQADIAVIDSLKILFGDCMTRMREIPDDSIDCVITSVPYYRRLQFPDAKTIFGGDRDCAHDWQTEQSGQANTCRKCNAQSVALGWETNHGEYVQHLVEVAKELKRVLKPKGVFWLNIGDTFLDRKLLLIPFRVGAAIADDGWICRQAAIWHVTNRVPENVIDRPYSNHEHVIMFVKQEHYYFDAEAIREPVVSSALRKKSGRFSRHRAFKGRAATWQRAARGDLAKNSMRGARSVMSIPTERFAGDHDCAFPRALVERLVLSSCPPGGICMDPFAGTGTAGLVALALGRRAILIEANAEYCGMAEHQIDTELEPYRAELENRRRRDDNDLPIAAVGALYTHSNYDAAADRMLAQSPLV